MSKQHSKPADQTSSELHPASIEPFEYREGQSPLVVSMPHSGLSLTQQVHEALDDSAKSLPDTDWYLPELYSFLAEYDVTQLTANYSRYVIDLNRPLDDKPLYQSKTTGLFPDILFDGAAVFRAGCAPDVDHREWCKRHIWQPYHVKLASELNRLRDKFGFVVLLDAHSIAARVPMLFTGQLPDFNFGNNDGGACSNNLLLALVDCVRNTEYSQVCNASFKGGYITRSKGAPKHGIHAVQLELSQATYMRNHANLYQLDTGKSIRVQKTLRQLVDVLVDPEQVINGLG